MTMKAMTSIQIVRQTIWKDVLERITAYWLQLAYFDCMRERYILTSFSIAYQSGIRHCKLYMGALLRERELPPL